MSDQLKREVRRVTLVFDVDSYSRDHAMTLLAQHIMGSTQHTLDPTPDPYVTHVETTVVTRPQEETR